MSKITSSEFWGKMRFKYKLSFLNENTLEEVFALRLSRLSGLLTALLAAVVLIALTSVVIIKTPIRNYLPGYLNSEIRTEMIQNALKVDSLEQKLLVQTKYLNNVSAIIRGDMKIEQVRLQDTVRDNKNIDFSKSKATSEFVKKYEEEEKYNISRSGGGNATSDDNVQTQTTNLMFYRPVKGIVSSEFDLRQKHYGIDIAAKPNEPALSTLKGTVIFTGFDADAGNIICVQHANGYMSVYKHNAKLLKNQGEAVSAGEAIALVGNTGNLSSGYHLHFELWYNGKPVNPAEYINFN
ncbi:MAG: M23 family metallopeptidase [Dysgonamonadaceae bacterium]|jgi:murein DD-endopeptidase MepM/ murein hydrolase activator NlpD|nr:M23 family metallopeptidase [Dysgonamonadaceae bacterium]